MLLLPVLILVDVDVGVEVVELDLRLNTLLEPEQIPILVEKDNEVTVWSEYQVHSQSVCVPSYLQIVL